MQTEQRLETYRRVLPAHEYAAFSAWLTTFYGFQTDWVLDTSPMALCNKSRQIGLSHTSSALGVIWGALHGELTTIISIGDRESVEVLEKARKHAAVLVRLGSQMARTGRKDNANELSFASGGRILALPSSGGRSFSGNVILDEYAYQQHADKVWDAAAAVTMLGWKLRVMSTPNGVGNDFHRIFEIASAPGSDWSFHNIPLSVALAQGYPVDIKKCWALAKGDPRIFDQLFNGSFLDNQFQYLPSELIEAASTMDAPPDGSEVYAGLDIGRTADRTELIIVRRVGNVFWVIRRESKKRTSPEDIQNLAKLAIDTYGARLLCVDATGMGRFPSDDLQEKYGTKRVEAIWFTADVKEDLATILYQRLASQSLKLPASDIQLRKDMASIRRIVTPSGNVQYDAPHTEAGHADSAWALALALLAGKHGDVPPRAHGAQLETSNFDDLGVGGI